MHSRLLNGPNDVTAVRRFIADNYDRTPRGQGWEIRRWEGRWWHRSPAELAAMLDGPCDDVRVWEAAGKLVAVAHPEGPGEVHLQLHPDRDELAWDMLEWAEAVLPRATSEGRTLTAFAPVAAADRIGLLTRRGYVQEPWGETQRWQTLHSDVAAPEAPSRYRLRSLRPGDRGDAAALATLINAAFNHSFTADDLLNFEHSPSFDHHLMIVAEAPDGSLAAHAGLTIDHVNHLAIVEPVCTYPEHRRLGLASVCIAEGLARSRDRGATRATIGAGLGAPSNAVYARLGFNESLDIHAWTKRFA